MIPSIFNHLLVKKRFALEFYVFAHIQLFDGFQKINLVRHVVVGPRSEEFFNLRLIHLAIKAFLVATYSKFVLEQTYKRLA